MNILYVSLEDREVKVILVPILKNNDEYVQIPCVYVYRHIRIFMYIQGWWGGPPKIGIIFWRAVPLVVQASPAR